MQDESVGGIAAVSGDPSNGPAENDASSILSINETQVPNFYVPTWTCIGITSKYRPLLFIGRSLMDTCKEQKKQRTDPWLRQLSCCDIYPVH